MAKCVPNLGSGRGGDKRGLVIICGFGFDDGVNDGIQEDPSNTNTTTQQLHGVQALSKNNSNTCGMSTKGNVRKMRENITGPETVSYICRMT